MSSECSLLCSLQLWTLKYAGLHERDISMHSYQQKPPSTKQSILPFIHNTSNSSSTNDKTPKKAPYYDEYNDYFTSRLLPFHISNKIFHNLRDKLNELDNLLLTLKLIRTIWIYIDTIFLGFSNGTFVFIFIDKINRTLKNILIDKTTLEKKFHITTIISDIYINPFGIYIIYDTLSKIDIFRFNKPIRIFDSKFNLSNESIRLTSEELPPYSNTIFVRRWFNIDHDHRTITVWWSMLNEGISTTGHLIDGDKKKTRFNCLSIIFPWENENEKEIMHTIQTETSNPYYCSSTSSGLTTIEMNENVDKNNLERTYELNVYYYENFRSVPLRLVHIPSLTSSVLYVIRSSSHTILCLTDATLISIDEINHIERSKLCLLTKNLTGLWWIIDNLLFSVADEQGSLIFYDIALNSIWPILSSNKKLNFHYYLNQNKSIIAINQLLNPILSSSSNLTLLLQFSHGGPIGLIDIHYPFNNIHSLFRYYLNFQNYSYIIDLLWCLDWTRQDNDCRLAISYIIQELFRNINNNKYIYIEQILRTFYSPLRSISDASILRNRSFINQISIKYFYYLLKEKYYSQALQLAKHLENRIIYLDLYYACDYNNEKTIMNICAEKLHLNIDNNIDNDDDNESGLSVTSSEDENDNDKIIKEKFPIMNEKQYGDINEILTSAIEHYKLDENMYKFLLDRIHAM
ncbi:unnamed protein product [Rotaria sp. Silwood1]|nr:unnamed protein product [Rotaria sp. Silwood1]